MTHAATPVQLCTDDAGTGFQLYFIGDDAYAETGPFIVQPSIGSQSMLPNSGSNPMTGKAATVEWAAEGVSQLKVSTYYPDPEYYTDKPCVFTIGSTDEVSHISW